MLRRFTSTHRQFFLLKSTHFVCFNFLNITLEFSRKILILSFFLLFITTGIVHFWMHSPPVEKPRQWLGQRQWRWGQQVNNQLHGKLGWRWWWIKWQHIDVNHDGTDCGVATVATYQQRWEHSCVGGMIIWRQEDHPSLLLWRQTVNEDNGDADCVDGWHDAATEKCNNDDGEFNGGGGSW